MNKIETRTVEINGLKTNYRVFGSESAQKKLLLLHGWNTTGSKSWEAFIQMFQKQVDANQIQIIAPDLPGMGDSTDPKTVWTVEDFAKHIHSFVQKINSLEKLSLSKTNSQDSSSKQIYAMGHSFGGAVCVWLVNLYPQTYSNLILVAPAIIRLPQTKKQKYLTSITKLGYKIFNFPILKPMYNTIKNIWYSLLKSNDYSKTSGIMKETMAQVIRQDLQFLLSTVSVESIIFWGTKDNYTPFWQAQVIHKQIKDSKLVVFKDINHGVHLYKREELFSAVLKHLGIESL